jgi:hypothetical protein
MTERTRKWLVYLTLPVAITWAAFNFPTEKNKPAAVEKPSTIAPVSAPVAKRPGSDLLNIEERQAATWGADPFRRHQPQISRPQRTQTWRLSGIVFGRQQPSAIINNKPVHTGDTIDNARVLSIDANSVTLEHNGLKLTLTVSKG